MNVQTKVHKLRSFITHLLVHIHQKKKMAVELAANIASVNGPLDIMMVGYIHNDIYR
jgi:hypothetical protein